MLSNKRSLTLKVSEKGKEVEYSEIIGKKSEEQYINVLSQVFDVNN
jgi:hypothetical protein